ncbi:hypothetical protein SDC9_134208 [bioreactor metagenome]|uniref:Uncharacterized protein n=1 Tax=bioreactor metagenome TaxID=1076179 RepID=A0A645DD40_9ZZZZ
MGHRTEFPGIASFSLHLLEAGFDHGGEQLVGLDTRYLDVSMGVAVHQQLFLDFIGKNGEHGLRALAQTTADERYALGTVGQGVESNLFLCQEVVDLVDQSLDLRDELNQAFGNKHHTEVVSIQCTIAHRLGDILNDADQTLLVGLDLFTDQTYIRLGLKSALQCDVTCTATHQFNEVPVLLGTVCIALDVADQLAVRLGGGIEPERYFDGFILQVPVDGLWATDDLDTVLLLQEILGKHTCIGV